MPRTDSLVRLMTSSSPISPAKPRLMPSTSQPRLIAESTAARMTALRPGASPPPVEMAIRISEENHVTANVVPARARGRRVQDASAPVASPPRGSSAVAKQSQHFTRLSVPARLRLLVDRHAVPVHLEPSAGAPLQLHLGVRVLLPELGRQTGGPGLVASHRAVFDRDLHRELRIVPGKYNGRAYRLSFVRVAELVPRSFTSSEFQFVIAFSMSANAPCDSQRHIGRVPKSTTCPSPSGASTTTARPAISSPLSSRPDTSRSFAFGVQRTMVRARWRSMAFVMLESIPSAPRPRCAPCTLSRGDWLKYSGKLMLS